MTDQEDTANVAESDADTSGTPPESGDADEVTAHQETEVDDSDVFDRAYVSKLRKESASYRLERDRLREQLATSQRRQIDTDIAAHGIKSDAVWAVVDGPGDLLGDDGQPDQKMIASAVKAAREKLGIKPERSRYSAGLSSGASSRPQPSDNRFVEAFKPAPR